MDWAKTTARWSKKHLSFVIWCDLYQRFYGMNDKLVLVLHEKEVQLPAPTQFWDMIENQNAFLCFMKFNMTRFDLLTHCGLGIPCGAIKVGQHYSGNGLLPDGTEPLSKPMLTIIFTWSAEDMNLLSFRLTLTKLLSHLPGANELNS